MMRHYVLSVATKYSAFEPSTGGMARKATHLRQLETAAETHGCFKLKPTLSHGGKKV